MNWLTKATAVGVILGQVLTVSAADGAMRLRLGASYRVFDDVDFGQVAFANWGTQSNPTGPYGVQGVTNLVGAPVGTPVTLDYMRFNGSDVGVESDSAWAPVLGLSWDVLEEDDWTWSVVSNLQAYGVDAGDTAQGDNAAGGNGFDLERYRHWVLAGGVVSPGLAVPGPGAGGTAFAVRSEFELDLMVLDLGLEARKRYRNFEFTTAAGPTLNYSYCDTSQREMVSWAAQAGGLVPAGAYMVMHEESDRDLNVGVYGSLGLNVRMGGGVSTGSRCCPVTLGLECRYDYVPDDVGTDLAEIDLSGFSGQVRLVFEF
jgi:hypothetical protein